MLRRMPGIGSSSSTMQKALSSMVLATVFALGASSPALGQSTAHSPSAGCALPDVPRSEIYTFYSPALRRPICAAVIRPPLGHPAPSDGYPLLVLLHGLGGAPADWFGIARFHERLAAARARFGFPPAYVVIPLGEAGYWSDARDGQRPWRTMVLDELLPGIDDPARFPGLARSPERRAIAGYSMGGFGALSIALQHPDRFGYAIGMSPTDMSIAITASNPPLIYARVFGALRNGRHHIDPAYLRRLNPFDQVNTHRVPRGPHPQQRFYLVHGTAEPAKFSRGTERLAQIMERRGLDVTHRVVNGGSHSFSSVWSHGEMERWLAWLAADWGD